VLASIIAVQSFISIAAGQGALSPNPGRYHMNLTHYCLERHAIIFTVVRQTKQVLLLQERRFWKKTEI
jgi:hypothetical protein